MTTYSAVRTTGIYCRPGCGAKPLAENVSTFELPAAAEAAGYRACLRCRPYRMAGTVADETPELVCRAVQLIIAGLLDEAGEEALGARLVADAQARAERAGLGLLTRRAGLSAQGPAARHAGAGG